MVITVAGFEHEGVVAFATVQPVVATFAAVDKVIQDTHKLGIVSPELKQ